MPQVDLETLVTACDSRVNDHKNMACGTLADDDDPPANDVLPDAVAAVEVSPESFWLSKDAEYDWFDRNVFYERNDSTKGNSNSTNLNPHINPSSNSNSQRFSVNLKSKASIIGLPKTQKTTFVDARRRICKPGNIRMFPKRSESLRKPQTPVEPGSPKVTCMGRVRSKRCRRRSNSRRKGENPAEMSKQKTGLYSKVMGMFRSKKGHRKPSRSGSRKVVEVLMVKPVAFEPLRKSKSLSVEAGETPVCDEPLAEPPGLAGMTRFVSGRRSGSWTSEDFNQAVSVRLGPTRV